VLRGREMPKARVNGININYIVQGQGEPLVLISGYGSDQTGWMFQTRAFKRYCRVVTFDNRGIGKTDKPGGPYSIEMMADDTVGLMDYLGIEKAHILGTSMGAMIAQVIAINYPERINKLILSSTFASRDEFSGFSGEFYKLLGLGKGYTDDEIRKIPVRRIADILFSLAFNKALYRTILLPLMKVQVRLTSATGLIGQWEAVLGHNAAEVLPKINAPTLIIVGAKDREHKTTSSEVIASLILNSKLVKIEGGSHALFFEMSGRFNREVLNFLKDS
jgi:3-oxoadipate enol-lactonase